MPAEVEAHREVAALLAHSGGATPDGVWQRIASSLEEAPPGLRLARERTPRGAPAAEPVASVRRWVRPAAVAAALVVAALGIQVQRQGDRIDELRTAIDDPRASAFQVAMQDPSARAIRLTSADGSIVVRGAVVDGVACVRADELPPLDAGRTYQLWGVAGDKLVSLGVLGRDPGIVVAPVTGYGAFAITEEAVPRVVVSSNPPVVAGELS